MQSQPESPTLSIDKNLLNATIIFRMNWLALLFALIPSISQAHPPKDFPYEWQFSADTDFIQTNSNFTTNGSTSELPLNGHLMNATSKFNFTYRQNSKWQIYAGADYSYSKSTTSNIERTTGGLPYIRVGLRHFLKYKKFDLIPIADLNIAIRKVDPYTDDVLISDGVSKFTLGTWMLTKWKKIIPYTFLGFTYCTDDFASPYMVRFGASYDTGSFSFFGEVLYFSTLINDKYLSNPSARLNVINTVDGGSFKFYSINPGHTDISGGISYAINPEWNAEFRIDYPFEGVRYPQSMSGTFRVSWNFGDTDADREILKNPKIKKNFKSEGKFKDKLEDADQELFE
ncbi:MAG: hypothetical protein A4S09_11690 [Proteobacteria bacterium SG_bin7]|nr:MAG: hypothetical protein A4S09_11690 [Proteobacteria bacterium SG_bin7]